MALALAFEVNGEGNGWFTTFVGVRHYTGKETIWCLQRFNPGAGMDDDAPFAAYFRLDRVLCSYHTTPCVIVLSFYRLSSPCFFLLFWK